MKLDIGGNEAIPTGVDALWDALNDPGVLTRCVPGCKTMTEIAPDAYKVEMQLRVAAVGGTLDVGAAEEGGFGLVARVPVHA